MKKLFLLSITILLSLSFSFSQEYIFKFNVNNKSEINTLTKQMSIDEVHGNEIIAYANAEEFEKFKELGYEYELLPHPGKGKSLTMATTVEQMANWDRYPTHDVLLEMMQQLATDYPDICKIEEIGTSEQGRSVKVLKITDNPDIDENEPEMYYTGQMHGDEIVAYIMFLRLAYHLLENYEKDQRITDLINNVEIWINPLSNPDGTYAGGNNTVSSASRSNSHGIDLNRNFPTPNYPNPSGQNEAEVQMQITFAENQNFVLSANSHSGIELVNFPWDTWTSSHPHADHDWWEQVSHNYANTVHENAPGSYMDEYDNGVTHGGDWYIVDGSRQDHMGYYQYCREVTLELSNDKMLDCELLPAHFTYNRDAMIGYIEETFYGIRGIVTDENENPLDATISISGHDVDNSEIVSDPATGNYHRMIDNGTYNLTFTVSGYSPITVNNISVTDNEITIIDVMFDGSPGTTTLTGTLINHETSEPIDNAEVIISGQEDNYTVYTSETGEYSVENVTVGTYKFEMSATAYMSAVHYETVSTDDSDVSKYLIPSLYITGIVIEAETGNIIEGAEIEILNSSLSKVTTNSQGIYYLSGILSGTYDVKAYYDGFAPQVKEFTVSGDNNELNFQLFPSVSLSFEDGIPSEFTFSGNADWTRVTDDAYDGDYSMKSGAINDNQSTIMEYTTTTEAGEFSYYMKIDTESGYDFVNFYIDNNVKNADLSGSTNWTEYSHNISAGSHTFKWDYSTDVSTLEKGAWVDYITLPAEAHSFYTITFEISDNDTPIEDANIVLTGYGSETTNIDGEAEFAQVYGTSAPGLTYSVTASGYETVNGNIEVTGDETIPINMGATDTQSLNVNNILIYPNPTNGKFLIDFSHTRKNAEITINDITGRQVYKNISHTGFQNIDFSEQEAGVYFIKLQIDDTIFNTKIVVQ